VTCLTTTLKLKDKVLEMTSLLLQGITRQSKRNMKDAIVGTLLDIPLSRMRKSSLLKMHLHYKSKRFLQQRLPLRLMLPSHQNAQFSHYLPTLLLVIPMLLLLLKMMNLCSQSSPQPSETRENSSSPFTKSRS
jgi:hypothetical protein